MIDDTQRPDSEPEFDEPVFKPDDPSPVQLEPGNLLRFRAK